MHLQSCYILRLNPFLSAVLGAVGVVVAVYARNKGGKNRKLQL